MKLKLKIETKEEDENNKMVVLEHSIPSLHFFLWLFNSIWNFNIYIPQFFLSNLHMSLVIWDFWVDDFWYLHIWLMPCYESTYILWKHIMSSSYKYMPYYESTYHLIYKLENIISYSTTYITLMPYSAKIVTLCHVTTLLGK